MGFAITQPLFMHERYYAYALNIIGCTDVDHIRFYNSPH